MKSLLLLIFTTIALVTEAQVLCIRCYDQNARVLNLNNDLILNGGFENGCPTGEWFCPISLNYNCNITDWTCTGGGINTYAHVCNSSFSMVGEGTRAAYFGNYYASACLTWDESCYNNIGCEITGIPAGYPQSYAGYGRDTGVSLSQTVNGLITGNIYLLEFWVGGEPGYNNDGLFAIDIGFGNIFLRDPTTPPNTGIGRRFVIVFTAVSSSHTIKFTNWGHIAGDPQTEIILDDVRLFAGNIEVNCSTLEINETAKNVALSFFPNPFGDILNITSNNNNSSEMTLYDITGRKLLQQQFVNSTTLFTGQLRKGLYNYEMISNGISTRGKLIKQ